MIERGGEADLGSLVQIARALEVPPETFFAGMRWRTRDADPAAPTPPPGRRYDPHENDAMIARLWREELTVPQIAHRLGLGQNAVRMIVARLRRSGRCLPLRQGPREPDGAMSAADLVDEESLAREETRESWRVASAGEARHHVGRTIRGLREEAGLALWQLGDAAGLQPSPLSKLETRGLEMRLTTLIRLAAGLRAPCRELLGGLRWDLDRASFVLPATAPSPRPTPAELVAANVRRARRDRGLSRRTVAARIGVGQGYLAGLEEAGRLRSSTKVLALAGGLGVEASALLEGVCDWYVRPLEPAGPSEGEEAAERQETLLRLWAEERPLGVIAAELGVTVGHVSGMVNRLRAAGISLPYRNRPASPDHLRTRLRRLRAARPLEARVPGP